MAYDTRYLYTFYVVCTAGTFSRAAERLHRTQPAVTHQIRVLERDFGARLFERGGRRAVLTPAGHRLLEFCRRYFAEFAELRGDALRGTEAPGAPLRIASVSGFGRYVLYPLLREPPFGSARLDLRFRTAADVLGFVESGDCDLGIVYLTKVSSYLALRPIYREELILITPARAAIEPGRLAQLETYDALPFVTYLECDYVFGKWFETMFGAQPAATVSTHHYDELEEVIDAVSLGRGASIVPADSAAAAIRRRKVRAVRPLRGRRCINQVYGVTRPGAVLRPELTALLDSLSAVADSPPRRAARGVTASSG